MSLSFSAGRGVRLAAAGAMGAAVLLGLATAAHADTRTAPAVDGPAGVQQPALRVQTLEDGTDVAIADPSAVDALTAAAAANRNCNSACDATDPNHVWSGGYTCASDAITVYGVLNRAPMSGYMVELRYSPQCRSAWARGDRARNFSVESFSGSKSHKVAWWNAPGSGPSPTGKTWTAMVNDKGYEAEACSSRTAESPHDDWLCTKRY
jgi:hypothetical protein